MKNNIRIKKYFYCETEKENFPVNDRNETFFCPEIKYQTKLWDIFKDTFNHIYCSLKHFVTFVALNIK